MPTEDIQIRRYEAKDLEVCRRLWVQLTEWHRRIYDDPSIGGSDPSRKFDEHLQRVGDKNIWVAEDDGRAIGMAGLIPGETEAELEPVVVDEFHRGSGIGRNLVEVVLDTARKRGLRIVTTRPVARNGEAIRFFHGTGFKTLGQVELFIDLDPRRQKRWRPGEILAGKDFLV